MHNLLSTSYARIVTVPSGQSIAAGITAVRGSKYVAALLAITFESAVTLTDPDTSDTYTTTAGETIWTGSGVKDWTVGGDVDTVMYFGAPL